MSDEFVCEPVLSRQDAINSCGNAKNFTTVNLTEDT